MKKSLLIASSLLLAASTVSAAVPEGNLYLMINGATEQNENNLFIPGERSEDDIEENLWRWNLTVEIVEGSGTLTVAGENGFTLGYYADEEMAMPNLISGAINMAYLAEGMEPVNYELKPGEYSVGLMVFAADEDTPDSSDSWMLLMKPLGGTEDDENFYLLGFNGVETASASNRFVKEVIEDEDATITTYSLPKFYVVSCAEGFTVLDSSNDVKYGKGDLTEDVTSENPMALLEAGGENVPCSLKEGYYDIQFASFGEMGSLSFTWCEDQTPNDELTYYLVGLDGTNALNDAYKFEREVVTTEYVDEDTEEVSTVTAITYTLKAEVKGDCELTIVSADGNVVYGYNSDMAQFLPNNFNVEMPFTSLVANGEAINCTLEPAEYIFTANIDKSGVGVLSAENADEGAVDAIEIGSDTAPVYYDLQGRRIQNPVKGIYIVKRGAKVSKVAL